MVSGGAEGRAPVGDRITSVFAAPGVGLQVVRVAPGISCPSLAIFSLDAASTTFTRKSPKLPEVKPGARGQLLGLKPTVSDSKNGRVPFLPSPPPAGRIEEVWGCFPEARTPLSPWPSYRHHGHASQSKDWILGNTFLSCPPRSAPVSQYWVSAFLLPGTMSTNKTVPGP